VSEDEPYQGDYVGMFQTYRPADLDHRESSILDGCHIPDYSISVFRDTAGKIDGLMMDAIFRSMLLYVTSILMAVCHNIVISITLASEPGGI
jgi:hypothetical protein